MTILFLKIGALSLTTLARITKRALWKQKLPFDFFTKKTAQFIFDVGIEDSITLFAEEISVDGIAAFQFSAHALETFPKITKKIKDVLNEAGDKRGIPALGGTFPEFAAFDLVKIRKHKLGKKIETTLRELEIAVKNENQKKT